MPGVLATHQPVTLLQGRDNVTVAHIGAYELDTQVSQCQLKAKVAHQRTDNATLQFATLVQVTGNDKQQLIAIDHGTGVIDHQHAIAVAIEGDTDVRMLLDDGSLQ